MTGRLRVLHVAEPVDGGVGRVVAQVVTDQVERGWDVVVACPDAGPLPGDAVGAGARHRPWAAARGAEAGTPQQVRALAALVRDVAPDVVHLHSASAGLTGRLAVRRRLPTLFQPHGWSWQAVDGAFHAATRAWEVAGQLLCDRIVCVSDDERRNGAEVGVRRGVVVVPNGVDLARFPVADGEGRAKARARLGLADVPTAVCVGRLELQKGQIDLVHAWPGVLRAVPDARLVLVGDGPAADEVREAVRALGLERGVELVGARSDVPDWYAAADVVAFSSRHGEAMALTPLEAQASGRSLVASDVAGVRASMAEGAGEVVPPLDVPAFATALARRLADPGLAAREGAAGRAHAESHLDVRVRAGQVAAHTEQVARRRGRRRLRPSS